MYADGASESDHEGSKNTKEHEEAGKPGRGGSGEIEQPGPILDSRPLLLSLHSPVRLRALPYPLRLPGSIRSYRRPSAFIGGSFSHRASSDPLCLRDSVTPW